MKLAVWSPLPPEASGVADYVAEQLPGLARHFEVQAVVEDPAAVDARLLPRIEVVGPARASADLHLYHLGNSPAHAYAYRAARARAGVSFLHEWSLHHLVLHETVERGDVFAYLREMRRAHGETGSFVGRQVARGLGGEILPALLPLNDRVLEASLAVVTLTREAAGRARRRISPRPVLALPMHFACPLEPAPSREEARRDLGLPADTPLVVAPGLCTAAKRVDLVAREAQGRHHVRGGDPAHEGRKRKAAGHEEGVAQPGRVRGLVHA
ncbi:MAG TPA: hypothetical protein VLL75_11865, partial [Vicinamibacteria bacterium]|nr:hypothetical protein [Vicinamibacteria bacterium]